MKLLKLFVRLLIPYRYRKKYYNYRHSLNSLFKDVLKTPSFCCHPAAEVSVHSVACHAHRNIYLLAVKSFLRYYNNVRIIVHDDGSLSWRDIKLLKQHVTGIEIIKRQTSDAKIEEILKSDKLLLGLRQRYSSMLKLIDVDIYGKTKKIVLDSDILFLNKPDEIITWIENDQNEGFYHYRRPDEKLSSLQEWLEEAGNDIDKVFAKYFFLENLKEINRQSGKNVSELDFCAGFMGYNRRLSIDEIRKVVHILVSFLPQKDKSKNIWGIEQETHALLLKEDSKKLDTNYYYAAIKPVEKCEAQEAKMIHFLGKLKWHPEYLELGKETINALRYANNSEIHSASMHEIDMERSLS